ncbi:hypothetical protein BH24ACT18_BH24ACT18_18570 [soil metagenome]
MQGTSSKQKTIFMEDERVDLTLAGAFGQPDEDPRGPAVGDEIVAGINPSKA